MDSVVSYQCVSSKEFTFSLGNTAKQERMSQKRETQHYRFVGRNINQGNAWHIGRHAVIVAS